MPHPLEGGAGVRGNPVVGPLSDTNQDGVVNGEDDTAVIFAAADGALHAVDGSSGEEIWTASRPWTAFRKPAYGDIDGDGLPEIVAYLRSGSAASSKVVAFDHAGTLLWETGAEVDLSGYYLGDLTISDLAGDGSAEIIANRYVLSNTGELLWKGQPGHAYADLSVVDDISHFQTAMPVDLDLDGDQEVLMGANAYSADGEWLWRIPGEVIHSGDAYVGEPDNITHSTIFTSVGNFDADDFPEIVVVGNSRVGLYEHTGEKIWSKYPSGEVRDNRLDEGAQAPALVADVLGTDTPEIVVAAWLQYFVMDADGSIIWRDDIDNLGPSLHEENTSTVFDFDADGRKELIFVDQSRLHIWDGPSGGLIHNMGLEDGFTYESQPVIANIDEDPGAELLVQKYGGTGGLYALEPANGHWAPTRSLWNQNNYRITNINDDGSIPAEEEPSWLAHNTYRSNGFPDRDPLTCPDMSASLLEVVDAGAGQPLSLRVRAGNAGSAATPSLSVTLFDGDAAGMALGSMTVPALAPGEWRDMTLDGLAVAELSGPDIVAVVDHADALDECSEANNVDRAPVATPSTLGTVGASTDGAVYGPLVPVSVTAAGANEGSFAGEFRIALRVEDGAGAMVADLGETDLGTLAPGESGSAAALWDTEGILAGTYEVVATLYGSDGSVADEARTAVTLQSTSGDAPVATLRTATNTVVYAPDDVVAIDHLVRNASPNALLPATMLTTVVLDPDGVERARSAVALGDLVAGAQRQRLVSHVLTGAAEGTWVVRGVVTDGQGVVVAHDETLFEVVAGVLDQVSGAVGATHEQRYVGESQTCTDTLENAGAAVDLQIRRLVLDRERKMAVHESGQTLTLGGGETRMLARSISTSGFQPGPHVCLLQARVEGQWVNLDHAEFTLEPPPINLSGVLEAGERGRLLVLVDPAVEAGQKAEDPHGPKGSPEPSAQRAWLEERLDEAGWSCTVVTDREAFATELRSAGYAAVALFNEAVKIAEADQRHLVEAVEHDGLGLLVAGMHDRRNGRIEAALGLENKGKLGQVDGLYLYDSEIATADQLAFAIDDQPLRFDLQGARSLGQYVQGGTDQGRSEQRDGDPAAALTIFDHGQGRSIDAGFDLLLQAAAVGGDNDYGELLLSALGHLHPDTIVPRAGGVWPLHVGLVNEGMATPGRVVLELPVGVSVVDSGAATVIDGALVWPFNLAPGETLERDVWLRLPEQPTLLVLEARIQTGTAPEWTDHRSVVHTLPVQ